MVYVSLGLALLILILAIVLAVKNRIHPSKWISCILIGILFSTFFMVLPTQWVSNDNSVSLKPLHNIVASILYSFKALGGRQDIAQLESIALTGFLRLLYIGINYASFVVAPILTSSLLLSFVGDMGEKMRYFLSHTPKCFIFSEINEDSLTLATGIRNKPGRKTIVFCGTKDADKALLAKAKSLGCILLYRSCKDLKLGSRFKEYEFFFTSENEDANIELAEDLISKKSKLQKYRITANAFVQSGTNINILESLIAKKPCAVFEEPVEELILRAKKIINEAPKTIIVFFNAQKADQDFLRFANENKIQLFDSSWSDATVDEIFDTYEITLYSRKETDVPNKYALDSQGLKFEKNRLVDKWVDDPLRIRFMDVIAMFCNSLLYQFPLYDLPAGRKDISVLLVGCGKLGMRMLKTAVWYGQLDGYTLKITVLDKDADRIQQIFYAQCPELKNYPIQFVNADVEQADFEETVKQCPDATYVCVATGSDELNISTAEKLYCIFRRLHLEYTPPIFTRIRKVIKAENFNEKGSFLSERNIHLFGTSESVYANNCLFDTQLENLALAVHLCYCWALDASKDSFEYKKALNDFYASEYSRRSSMAVALHISAKLRSCGVITDEQIKNRQFMPTEENLAHFEKLLQDPVIRDQLIQKEHQRWNAFVRSEGYRSVDFETVKKYAPHTRSHKDDVAKLHPCILSWEELDVFQAQYNQLQQELNLKKSNFKEYDEKIVVEIPKIIRKANELLGTQQDLPAKTSAAESV